MPQFDPRLEVRLTRHAVRRWRIRGIARSEIEDALHVADEVIYEETVVRIHHITALGDRLVVYVKPHSDYNLILTVWTEERR